jgi:aspartokinase-like uncharacterized kinase
VTAAYAGDRNFVVAMDVKAAYERSYGAEIVRFVGLRDLIEGIAAVEERRPPQRGRRRKPGRR